MTRLKRRPVALAALVLTGSLAAGGASSISAAAAPRGHTAALTLTIGVSPTISSADVLYAEYAGLFKKEGLSVTTSVNATSGAATFPELLNGQLDVTVVDPVSPILAIGQGVPLDIVAQGNIMAKSSTKNYCGIVVKAGSGINSVKDLAGKTIAVNSLDSVLQLEAEAMIKAGGGNPSATQFVEVPPPSEINAVAQGQVAGFVNVEPLLTEGAAAGLTTLAHPPASLGGLPQDVLVTSSAFAKAHKSVIKKFSTAMSLANAALAKHPGLIQLTAVAENELSSTLANEIILPVSAKGTVTAADVNKLEGLMLQDGFMSSRIPASKILPAQNKRGKTSKKHHKSRKSSAAAASR
jgi:NitT/TauT family transport system substrate-binding protein